MNYYKRHLGDFAKDTAHLTALEVGIYDLLLDRYYATEKPIPQEDVYRIARARTPEDRIAVDAVLREFFKPNEGAWVHNYAERTIAAHQHQAEVNREIGKRGGRPVVAKEPKANPIETDSVIEPKPNGLEIGSFSESEKNPIHKPLAISHKEEKKKRESRASRVTPLPDGFGISERVRDWAAKKGHGGVQENFDALVSYAKRKSAKYADWDEALMTAIRENWAKVPKTVPTLAAGEYD